MIHTMPRVETQKRSHLMSTDCACKPTLKTMHTTSWAIISGLVAEHHTL